ncbi:hypothetical protein [Actinoplanes aureus]|uniref:Uncharacterized protein n=1 Tax=Actinoplanes aureus TaxID=2792083 RepID=A0A931G1I7_9ACTN|nr:hypothetical protein [Actinoplanes aureus]MBG0567060.1 hypothetical protein [Actinoplanes aureus]
MRLVRWLTAYIALIVCVAAVSLMVILSRGYVTPRGVEPAKITDWMQAWASIFAVIAGLGAALFTALLLVHEMTEARRAREDAAQERAEAADDRMVLVRDREDQHKRFARLVFAWGPMVTYYPAEGPPEQGGADRIFVSSMELDLHNFSPATVTDVTARVVFPGGKPMTDWHVYGTLTPDLELVPGRYQRRGVIFNFPEHKLVTRKVLEANFLSVVLIFRDANGRQWRRIDDEDPVPDNEMTWSRVPSATLLEPRLRQNGTHAERPSTNEPLDDELLSDPPPWGEPRPFLS